ncbi:hypothetical protein B0H19DRAFT_1084597 [Mycena capillaripes]|nr:hypothetical protein B0H19DRAFT_1084597 [Mycena capillaripes]
MPGLGVRGARTHPRTKKTGGAWVCGCEIRVSVVVEVGPWHSRWTGTLLQLVRARKTHWKSRAGWLRFIYLFFRSFFSGEKKERPDDRPRRVRNLSAKSAEVKTGEGRARRRRRVIACRSGDVGGGVGIEGEGRLHIRFVLIVISSRRRRGTHAKSVLGSVRDAGALWVPRSGRAQMPKTMYTPRWGTRKPRRMVTAVQYSRCETRRGSLYTFALPALSLRSALPRCPKAPIGLEGRTLLLDQLSLTKFERETTRGLCEACSVGLQPLCQKAGPQYCGLLDLREEIAKLFYLVHWRACAVDYDTIERDSLGSGPGILPRRNSPQVPQIILCRSGWTHAGLMLDNIIVTGSHGTHGVLKRSTTHLEKMMVANPTIGRGEFAAGGVQSGTT